jgi:hypothetical protein
MTATLPAGDPPRSLPRLQSDDERMTSSDGISTERGSLCAVTLSDMRPHASTLDLALRDVSTASELLDSLDQPDLARRLPGSLTVDDLLALADHEAALRRHPYLGREHVLLAASRICDDTALYRSLSEGLSEESPRRGGLLGWRPRGPRSMARSRARRRLEAEQQDAQRRDRDASGLDGTDGADASQ